MILIVSNERDYSTGVIIKFLMLNGYSYIRLTESQFIKSLKIEISPTPIIKFETNEQVVDYKDIKSFWFRKNKIELFKDLDLSFPSEYSEKHCIHLEKFIHDEELNSIRDFLVYMLEKKNFLGKVGVGNGNKLISFIKASESGLQIPKSILSSNLQDLKDFSSDKVVMAKPIEEGFYFHSEDYFFYSKNELFDTSKFNSIGQRIAPSVLQEYIEKKLELRIFYLNDSCYSMAVFSQSDPKTKVDFRNYNDDKPNRMVPYQLPATIQKSIKVFMGKMDLRSGSIDMILTKKNEYVFLEVNPVGQYGMVSTNCNYPLDKLIFNDLTMR